MLGVLKSWSTHQDPHKFSSQHIFHVCMKCSEIQTNITLLKTAVFCFSPAIQPILAYK